MARKPANDDHEIAVSTEMMLESTELVIKDPMSNLVGVAIKGLLAAQVAIQVCHCLRGHMKWSHGFIFGTEVG